jgi:hypothetical protein
MFTVNTPKLSRWFVLPFAIHALGMTRKDEGHCFQEYFQLAPKQLEILGPFRVKPICNKCPSRVIAHQFDSQNEQTTAGIIYLGKVRTTTPQS